MKIKIRQHDASMPQEDGWSQTGDWPGELRDDNRARPPGDGHAGPGGADDPWPEILAHAGARAETPGEAAVMPAAVMTTCLETGPEQLAITPGPAPAKPLTVMQRNRPRPLEVAQCSMCGIALPLGLLVPDGGQACADIRWYCKDAMSCTERWATARPPGRAHMPAAPGAAFAGAAEAGAAEAGAAEAGAAEAAVPRKQVPRKQVPRKQVPRKQVPRKRSLIERGRSGWAACSKRRSPPCNRPAAKCGADCRELICERRAMRVRGTPGSARSIFPAAVSVTTWDRIVPAGRR